MSHRVACWGIIVLGLASGPLAAVARADGLRASPSVEVAAPAIAWQSRWSEQLARIQDHIDHERCADALAEADVLLVRVRAEADLKELAELLLLRGEALMGLDRVQEAGSAARTALGLGSLLEDPHVLACAFNDLGILAEDAGRPRTAAGYYRQALELVSRFVDPPLVEAILFDLGSAECRMGRAAEGLSHIDQGRLAASQRGDRLAETRFMVRLAEFQQEFSKPGAEDLAIQARDQARDLRHSPSEQGAERVLALCRLVARDLPGAEKHLRAALKVAVRAHSEWGEAQAAFELGLFTLQHGKKADAVVPLERAATLFRKLGKKELASEVKALLQRVSPARSS